jgi:hypothetical protein
VLLGVKKINGKERLLRKKKLRKHTQSRKIGGKNNNNAERPLLDRKTKQKVRRKKWVSGADRATENGVKLSINPAPWNVLYTASSPGNRIFLQKEWGGFRGGRVVLEGVRAVLGRWRWGEGGGEVRGREGWSSVWR